jgi:hypothetical protein
MPQVLLGLGHIALLFLAFQSAGSSRKEWDFVNLTAELIEGN